MITEVYNNFIRGQIDHDMNGRFDLPIYQNGFEYSRNFYVNYKGNLKNRTGLEYVATATDCVLKEFRFNKDQTYLMLIRNNYIDFYTYDSYGDFGYVTTLQTELSLANARKAKFAQNADVMYVTHENSTPRIITRTGASTFTWGTPTMTGINFTDMGNPRACAFYQKRLWFGGFTKKPVSIVGSESGIYTNFTITTQNIVDSDPVSITLSDITDPIWWIDGGKKNLNVGNAEGVSLVNGGSIDTITPTLIAANLANSERANSVTPVVKDGLMFYGSLDNRKMYYFQYDLMTESFVSTECTLVSKDATVGKIKKIVYKRDDNDLLYVLMDDGTISAVVFNKDENINGWFPIKTDGNIMDIEAVTRPDGKDDLYFLVERGSYVYLERMTDEVEFTRFLDTDFQSDPEKEFYNRLTAEELKNCVYLDCSSKYNQYKSSTITFTPTTTGSKEGSIASTAEDFTSSSVGHYICYKTKTGKEYGVFEITAYTDSQHVDVIMISEKCYSNTYTGWYLSFSAVSGFSDFNGKKLSVVADGGYLGDFTVSNGAIALDRECQSVVIGLKYEVIANTFPLGQMGDGGNGQTIMKNVARYIVRFVDSAGAEIGTDLNAMQEIQEFNPAGFFDLPPLLMNGDLYLTARDKGEREKRIYIVQNFPLPFNLTMLQLDTDYRRIG